MEKILRFDKNGKFRILQLTDIQFIKNMDKKSKEVMDKTIAEADPDLIVLTGDQISGEYMWHMKGKVKRLLRQIADYFESKSIPWTMCFGNHDGIWKKKSKLFMLDIYKSSKYFIGDSVSTESLEVYCDNEKDSVANYFMTVCDETNKPEYGILVMDTESCLSEPYKNFSDKQLEFYDNISRKYSGLPLVMFTHLPLRKMQEAYDLRNDSRKAIAFKGEIERPEIGRVYYANKPLEQNDKLERSMLEHKNIKGVFVGHDHLSNFAVNYNMADDYNLIMAYGRLSTYAFGCWQYCPFSVKTMKFYKNYPKGGRVIDLYKDGNLMTFDMSESKEDGQNIVCRNEMKLY